MCIRDRFDDQKYVPPIFSAHSTRSDVDDVAQVVSVLLKNKILEVVRGRKHSLFTKLNENPLFELDRETKGVSGLRRKKRSHKI